MSARNDYSWQYQVGISEHNTVVVQAPEKSGKTFLCRDRIMDFINSEAPGGNLLYFSPKKGEASRVAHTVEILLNRREIECSLARNGVYITEDQNLDTAVYAPTSHEALAHLLESGTKFKGIIVDNAESVHNTLLWTMIYKAKIDDAKLFVIGGDAVGETSNRKQIMSWLMNHPCAAAFRVHAPQLGFCTAPEALAKGTEEFMNRIREMLKKPETAVA